MNRLLFSSIIAFCLIIGLNSVFSAPDSNGVWHRVEDIRPGIFADDEAPVGAGSFTFNHPVYFMDPNVGIGTNTPSVELQVSGDILANNLEASSLTKTQNLEVTGNSLLNGNVNVNGFASFAGNIEVLGSVVGDLAVTGTSSANHVFTNTIKVSTDAEIDGDLIVGGNVQIAGQLQVSQICFGPGDCITTFDDLVRANQACPIGKAIKQFDVSGNIICDYPYSIYKP